MALWKQLLLSLIVIGLAGFAWYSFFPGSKDVLARFGVNVQAAQNESANGQSAQRGAGGGRRGGFGGGGFGGRATTVVVQPAGRDTINDTLSALGTGVALHSVTVTPNSAGTLADVLVQSGARVKAGDVIAKLDSNAQQIAADKARLVLQDAQATLDRYQQLSGSSAVTAAQVQAQKLAVDTAQLNLKSAEFDLANRTITAPIDGTIGIVQVDVGNAVTTQTEIATIEDRSSLLVSFWVPERLVGQVKVGDALTAVPIARPQEEVTGAIAAVDNKIDTASGTFEVQAKVPNPKDDLRAGMGFTVKMKFPGEEFVTVDPLAIQWGSDGAYVWRVKDSKAERADIRIVQRNTEDVLVAGDVTEGDQIVTEGLDGLRAGADVQIYGQPANQGRRWRCARRLSVGWSAAPRAGRWFGPAGRQWLGAGAMSIEAKNRQGGALASLFVRRPVMAFVVNAIIVVAGLAALFGVQVRELPNVSRPVITVSTSYDGASAETVDNAVTSVIEGAVARVSGVTDISSSSRFGSSRTTIEFDSSTDLNVAASDVRDAVSRAARQLPDDAGDPTVVKADANSQAIIRLSVTSDTMGIGELTDLVNSTIVDRLAAVPGVADVQLYGDESQIFNVDINQAKLAARGLTLADVTSAMSTISLDTPAGTLNATNQNIIVRATANVTTPEQFEAIELKPGVHLGDVATVYLEPNPGGTTMRSGGKSGIGLGIVGQAQSNTVAISSGVTQAVADLKQSLPQGVNIAVSSDDAIFIRGAIEEVVRSLVISVIVVTAIIFVFLRDVRATLIPAVSIPVALAGALAGIYLAGFSVNILTLLALVLATGLVVDDAIVVLENIVRQRSLGLGQRAAAVMGTQEVFFAVVATTVTLAAVFIPISFLPGQAGGLFREFGFTLAIAVLISSIVALSLAPMMGSRFLKAASGQPRKPGPVARFGNGLSAFYVRTLHGALNAPMVVLVAAALAAGIAYFGFVSLHQELTPTEDRSQIAVIVRAPQNVSLDYTNAKMSQIEALIEPLKQTGEVENVFSISGFGGNTNTGFINVTLAPWDQRTRSQQDIANDINRYVQEVPGVRAFAVSPNSLGIRGGGNGLQFAIVGNSYDTLAKAADTAVAALSADPRFGNVRSSYDTTQAQLHVQVDRQRAAAARDQHFGAGHDAAGHARRQAGGLDLHQRHQHAGLSEVDQPAGQRSHRSGEHFRQVLRRALCADVLDHFDFRATGRTLAQPRIPTPGDRHYRRPDRRLLHRRCLCDGTLPAVAAVSARRFDPAAGGSGDHRGERQRAADHFRVRGDRHPSGAGGAVRKLHFRAHHHGDGPVRAGVRCLCADADGRLAQCLFGNRAGAAGRHHGQERHSCGGVRQPAARPRHGGAAGDRGSLAHPLAADHDDKTRNDLGRHAAHHGAWRGGGSPVGAGLGDRRRAGFRCDLDALSDAGDLSGAGPVLQAALA